MSIDCKLFDNSETVRHQIVQAGDIIVVYILAQYLLKFLPGRCTVCSKGSGGKEQNVSMFWVLLETFSKKFNKEFRQELTSL